MRIRFIIILCSLLFSAGVSGQGNRAVDSLEMLLKKDAMDTNRVNHLIQLSLKQYLLNTGKAIENVKEAIDLTTQLKWLKGQAGANSVLGYIYYQKGNNDLALKYYEVADKDWDKFLQLPSLSAAEKKLGLRQKNAELVHRGMICKSMGNYDKTLAFDLESYKTSEKTGDKKLLGDALVRLGIVYMEISQFTKSLHHYERALKLFKEIGNKPSTALTLGNIGNVHFVSKNYPEAKKYYFEALRLHTESGDQSGINYDLGYVGGSYFAEADQAIQHKTGGSDSLIKKAMEYYNKALVLAEKDNDELLCSNWLASLGEIHFFLKDYKKAEDYYQKALFLTEKLGLANEKMQFEALLSDLYEKTGEHRKSYIHYKNSVTLRDSLFNAKQKEQILKNELNYEFDKKESLAKAEQERKDAISEAGKNKQKVMISLVSGILVLTLIFFLWIIRALKHTREQRKIIEIKNQETEFQKALIEEKNNDILDSIHYARRMQVSLLPTEKYIERTLNRFRT